MASKVLTITIGSEYIKISEVSCSPQKTVHVFKSVTAKTPEGLVDDGELKDTAKLAAVITEAVTVNGIASKDVIFSMQSSKIASKDIIVPALKDAKLGEYIAANATDYFPVDNIDDYTMTYSVMESITEQIEEDDEKSKKGPKIIKKQRLMLSAAPSSVVEPYYQLAKTLGFNVIAIDYTGNSTINIIKYQIDAKPTIVIQMGEENTMVCIMKDNILQLMRSVPYGRGTVINALMEKRDITYEEANETVSSTCVLQNTLGTGDYVTDSLKYLCNNISRVMDYYTTKNPMYPIEDAYIITEGEVILGLAELFTHELIGTGETGFTVKNITELRQVVADQALDIPKSSLSIYLANIGAAIAPVNFKSRYGGASEKSDKVNKYVWITLGVSVIVASILIAYPVILNLTKKLEKKDLQNKIDQIKYVQETVNDYYDAMDKYSDIAAFDLMAANPDDNVIDFITYLETNMPSDISINSMSVASGSVSISCQGSSKESMAAFITALKASPDISNVYSASLSESMDINGIVTVSYSITCYFAHVEENAVEEGASSDETVEETTAEDTSEKDADDILNDVEKEAE